MEIKQLATFKQVARSLSFSQTAQNLNYAQSTVTAQIQALEKELGTPLFNRLGKRISLTEAGQQLLDYAERLTRMEEEARKVVAFTDEEPSGSLMLAAAETIISFHLPKMLRTYRQRYPAVQVNFYPGDSGKLLDLVQNGEVDLALFYKPRLLPPVIEYEAFANDTLRLLAAADHPLAQYAIISPEDLQCESLLLTDRTCTYRQQFDHVLRSAGIDSASRMEFLSTTALKQCILAGLGIGWLPEKAVRPELDSGELVILPWPEEALSVTAVVGWHQDKWMSPAAHAFRRLLREMLSEPVAAESYPNGGKRL
jgi:DNA-binding transcriptional LysR family regulator